MADECRRQVEHYNRCIKLLERVDEPIYRTGRDIFSSDAGLADWLCTPARSLGGRVPLDVMRTAAGRVKVAEILTALAHGVML